MFELKTRLYQTFSILAIVDDAGIYANEILDPLFFMYMWKSSAVLNKH